MTLLLKIDLVILLLLVIYTFVSKDPRKVFLYAEIGAFVVFELLFVVFHPIVGIISVCAFVFFGMLVFIEKYDMTPGWWKIMIYVTLICSVASIVFQIVEVFAGKLF